MDFRPDFFRLKFGDGVTALFLPSNLLSWMSKTNNNNNKRKHLFEKMMELLCLLHSSPEHLIGCDEHHADDESNGEGTNQAFPHARMLHLLCWACCVSMCGGEGLGWGEGERERERKHEGGSDKNKNNECLRCFAKWIYHSVNVKMHAVHQRITS